MASIPTPPGTDVEYIYYLNRILKNGFVSRLEMRPRGLTYTNPTYIEIPKEAIISIESKGFSWEDIPVGLADTASLNIKIDIKVLMDVVDDPNISIPYKTAIELLYSYIIYPSLDVTSADGEGWAIDIRESGLNNDWYVPISTTINDEIITIYNTWILSTNNGDTSLNGYLTITEAPFPTGDDILDDNQKPKYIEGIYSQKVQSDKTVILNIKKNIIDIDLTDSVYSSMDQINFRHLEDLFRYSIFWLRTYQQDIDNLKTRYGNQPTSYNRYYPWPFSYYYISQKSLLDINTNKFKTWDRINILDSSNIEETPYTFLIGLDMMYELIYLCINAYWVKYVMHNIDVKQSNKLLSDNFVSYPSGSLSNVPISNFRHPYFYHNFYRQIESSAPGEDYFIRTDGTKALNWNTTDSYRYANQVFVIALIGDQYDIENGNIIGGLFSSTSPDSLGKTYNNIFDFFKDNISGSGCYGKVQYSPVSNFNGVGETGIDATYQSNYIFWEFFNAHIVAQPNSANKSPNPTITADIGDIFNSKLTLTSFLLSSIKTNNNGFSKVCNPEAINHEYKTRRNRDEEELNIKNISFFTSPTADVKIKGSITNVYNDNHFLRKLYTYNIPVGGNGTIIWPTKVYDTVNLFHLTQHDEEGTLKNGWNSTGTVDIDFNPTNFTNDEGLYNNILTRQENYGYARCLTHYLINQYTFKSQYKVEGESIYAILDSGETIYLYSPRNSGMEYNFGVLYSGEINSEIINTYGKLPSKGILIQNETDFESCLSKITFFLPGSHVTGEKPIL